MALGEGWAFWVGRYLGDSCMEGVMGEGKGVGEEKSVTVFAERTT